MDAVVIGGGIVGLASAYYLAEGGADVILCERAGLGSGSTERSAGGIRAQFSTPVNVELSVASLRVWESFEERFGADIAHRRVGYLLLARSRESADALREDVAVQNERGVPSELLDPEEAREHCPGLCSENFVAATYSPTDGFADPRLALQGFAAGARGAGAEIRTGTPVTAIHRRGDAVVGVTAGGERLDADVVVNAAGPWARRVAAMAGVDLPVAPRRRQLLVVEPERPVPEDDPLVIDIETTAHFRPEREGLALVGGHFGEEDPDRDPDAYRESFDPDWAAGALERAGCIAEYFGPGSRIRRGRAGLYAVTPDHHPVVEETVPGFVNAVGFSGHGFMHAPATGQVVAELALDGEASLLDVTPLRSARFEEGDLLCERNVA